MDGCLEGCAGCFLTIVLFAIFLAIAYVFLGTFWIAFGVAAVFLLFIELGKASAKSVIKWIDKKIK